MSKTCLFHLLSAGLLLTCAVGCGSGLATVDGTVSLDGQPVDRGMISLEPLDGKGPTVGANVEGGKFVVADVLPGKKKVQIFAVKKIGEKIDADVPGSAPIEITQEIIPAKYNATTELTLEVTAPATTHSFELKST